MAHNALFTLTDLSADKLPQHVGLIKTFVSQHVRLRLHLPKQISLTNQLYSTHDKCLTYAKLSFTPTDCALSESTDCQPTFFVLTNKTVCWADLRANIKFLRIKKNLLVNTKIMSGSTPAGTHISHWWRQKGRPAKTAPMCQ